MPTYNYRCSACKFEQEIRHSVHDEPIKHCPECQEETFEIIIKGSPTFLLIGDGWASNEKSGKWHQPKGTK